MEQWTLTLNARLQPIHRHEIEDILDDALHDLDLGEVCGGGTALSGDGEVEYCELELNLRDASGETLSILENIINHLGIAKGSALRSGDLEIPVGTLEGLAFYSNGTDLPKEVYESCDINFVVEQMERLMEGIGSMHSYWEGTSETALYFYGSSFEEMKKRIIPFIKEYPLCQKGRIVQIA